MMRVVNRGGELRVLRVREHPLSAQMHPLTAKSTPSRIEENVHKTPFETFIQQIYGD